MAGSLPPAMTVWLYPMDLFIRLHMELALFCLTAKIYISSLSLHSCKFSRETALECVARSIVDVIYYYSIEENNSHNTWIINNRSLELSPYSSDVLNRYSVYGT